MACSRYSCTAFSLHPWTKCAIVYSLTSHYAQTRLNCVLIIISGFYQLWGCFLLTPPVWFLPSPLPLAVRIPSLLLCGEGSGSVGLEQRAARAGGTRQAAHEWLTSRRVICCLSHFSLFALYPLKETPVFQRLIPVFQLSLTGCVTSAADQQEILPRTFPGCLAEIICSFLPFPLLKHHELSSHTPPRQQKQTWTGG